MIYVVELLDYRPITVLFPPIAVRCQPYGKSLRKIFVRMSLGIAVVKMFDIAFGVGLLLLVVVLAIRLATRTPGWADLSCGLVGLFIVGIGMRAIANGLQSRKAMGAFERASTDAKAIVLDRYAKEHEDEYGQKSYTYHITVQFNAGGRQMTLQARVSKEIYSASKWDQTRLVRYAHANPHIFLVKGEPGFGDR